MLNKEQGIYEGDLCNRNNCKGIIQEESEKEGCCSCHINPPCSYCTDCNNYCPECDWCADDDDLESDFLKAPQESIFNAIKENDKLEKEGIFSVLLYFDNHFERFLGQNLRYSEAKELASNSHYQNSYYYSIDIRKS